jgi:hypothetical protein
MSTVLDAVRAHLRDAFAGPVASASVTFLGTEPLEVLRFGPDATGTVRYATVGVARRAMHPPTSAVLDPLRGPRAELVLSLAPARDDVLRSLAVLAATPDVEGIVLTAGATLDLQAPLWSGARVSAALLGQAGGLVPDLDLVKAGAVPDLDGVEPVRFHPVLPMTASEAALSRARGSAVIQQLWLESGTDLRDPDRLGVV